MIKILFALLIFSPTVFAQTTAVTVVKKPVAPKNAVNPAPNTAPTQTISAAAAPTADAPPPPSPWKLTYFGEYQGPALSNFDLSKTQTPGQPEGPTEWDHYLMVGYQFSKSIIIGTQFRGVSPIDSTPGSTASFSLLDQRIYVKWKNMIDTSDVNMAGKLTFELPTTDKSRTAGKIIAFKIEDNVEFKTPLRNWSFTADFLLKPVFYNDPVSGSGKTDMIVGVFPYITVDLTPSTQLLFEGSFDATHNYNANFYDYLPGDPNYIDVGPLFTITSHFNTNVALRFFTDEISFKSAALYANFSATL